MSEIEVRSEDRVFWVSSIEDLVAMVRSGRVGRAAQVKLPGHDDFVRADSLSQVSGALEVDPWSAWETETDESVLDAFVPKKAPVPAVDSLPKIEEDPVEELPASALAPMEPSSARTVTGSDSIPTLSNIQLVQLYLCRECSMRVHLACDSLMKLGVGTKTQKWRNI